MIFCKAINVSLPRKEQLIRIPQVLAEFIDVRFHGLCKK